MVDGRLLARARDALARRREENAALRREREREVWDAVPEIRGIDRRLRALVGEVVGLTAAGGDPSEALAEIGEKSAALCAERSTALASHGFPAGYLDDVYTCPDCRDSGFLRNGEMCACLTALYEAERERELASEARLGAESFSDFDLSYYEGAARECMELTANTAREYAVNFGPESPNLLFQGGTGLGKTFLSGCVAKVVSGRGFSVVYESAQGAFGAFEEQKFSRGETDEAAEKVRRILSCELLILDDLGTEMTTSFTQSALYNILDARLTAGKKTIVSTNLSDAELAARYIPQAVSRLNGEFDTLLFMGRDIRAIKKERRYR